MKIYAIALNTFKEVIRDKIFYSLVFFALLILGSSVLLSTLTVGERTKIIEDVSSRVSASSGSSSPYS